MPSHRQRIITTDSSAISYGLVGGARVRSTVPEIWSVTPALGSAAGGVPITIVGTNFQLTPTVTIGGIACTSVVRTAPNVITCVTPHCGGVAGVGLQNVVITNPNGQAATKASAYRQQLQLSYDTDGTNEYARNLSIAAPPNGALSIAGWVYSAAAPAIRNVFMLADTTLVSEWILFQTNSSGHIFVSARTGGITAASSTVAQPVFASGQWTLFCGHRTVAGVWRMSAGLLGGVLYTGSNSAVYDAIPSVTQLSINANPNGAGAINGRAAIAGLWNRDIFSSGELATWFANPQAIPATPRNAIVPGLETAITTLYDWGSDGSYDVSPQNAEAGDLTTAYPGV